MELLAGAAIAGKEIFSYNRDNYKFDQDQRLDRETLRLEMQVKRFELFREDVRDLVELTVDRMDVYHLVVWLSMHASIASHSFGVRLLTRFVRLPIPSMKKINELRTHLKDYERQGIGKLLRLPFIDREAQQWESLHADDGLPQVQTDKTTKGNSSEERHPAESSGSSSAQGAPVSFAPPADGLRKAATAEASPPRLRQTSDTHSSGGASSSGPGPSLLGKPQSLSPGDTERPSRSNSARPSPRPPAIEEINLLPENEEAPIGGEDLLSGSKGAIPQRHVRLFRQLQSKWQCYDAYCRVCMGLGVNQLLQALSYYAICHTLVENRTPTTGYSMIILFQCTTVALAVLDLAGLKRREIIAVQTVGIMPAALTAWGIAHGERSEKGDLDPDQMYKIAPFTFLCQAFWLELWLRVAAPSGDDKARLPRRFRQVLFLDVFGDAFGWDPTHGEGDENEFNVDGGFNLDEDLDEETEDAYDQIRSAAQEAVSQLFLVQSAIRRWLAAPEWTLSHNQAKEIKFLKDQYNSWGTTIKSELERCDSAGIRRVPDFRCETIEELRPWAHLDEDEKAADPFAKCLLGPFHQDGGDAGILSYHYDVETSMPLWEDAVHKERPGGLVLELKAVYALLQDVEKDARRLLELRIMQDLSKETKKQKEQRAQQLQANGLPSLMGIDLDTSNQSSATRRRRPRQRLAAASRAVESFPNLVNLFKRKREGEDRENLLDNEGNEGGSEARQGDSRSPVSNNVSQPAPSFHEHASERGTTPISTGIPSHPGQDQTLIAMAGEHAQHFVPERLPWQIVSRMTRVLQLCWFISGLMHLLREADVYQVDFQQHPGSERRRLSPGNASRWIFEPVDVSWPHGDFFRPQGLFCLSSTPGLVFTSAFATYAVKDVSASPLQTMQIGRSRMPSATVVLCSPQAKFASCLLAAPAPGGIEIWFAGDAREKQNKTKLSVEGPSWRSLAGAVVRCASVPRLLPPKGTADMWCLLFVGWDGDMLPIAIVPLPDGPQRLPAEGRVRPALDVPLSPKDARDGVSALHLEPNYGRLWALLASGNLEAWDLLDTGSLGQVKPRWSGAGNAAGRFQAISLCEDAIDGSIFTIGLDRTGRTRLMRGVVPKTPRRATVHNELM